MVRVIPDEMLELDLIDEDLLLESEMIYLNEDYISLFLPRKKIIKQGKTHLYGCDS